MRSIPRIEAVRDSSIAARYAARASRHLPACSNSIAFMGRLDSACARAGTGASAITAIGNVSATRRTLRSDALRLLRIDALEVIEHQPPLFGREPAEVVPARRREPRCRLPVRRRVRRHEQIDPGRRLRFTLPGVFALVTLQRPAGIEHSPEQTLLPVDHVRIERTALEGMGELPRLLGQLVGAPRP